jgi:DNA-binding CsgD family transcriptional regulator
MEAVATAHLTRARELHAASRWEEACSEYAAADAVEPLAVRDLEAYAEAAQVSARGTEAVALLRRVFELRVGADEIEDAAYAAFWLWWAHFTGNELVQANGWLQQVGRTLGPELAGSPWLRIPEAMFHGMTGNRSQAEDLLRAIVESNRGDIVPWALSVWGQTLIDAGRLPDGLDRLEEAMAALYDGGLSARVTPWIYCAAVRGCCLARDFARARAWNRSMAGWLDSLTSLGGAYLGNCRIYRSRLMCLTGAWRDALNEIAAVCEDLDGYAGWVCGHAFYQLGEVQRLRGDWEIAEEAYRRAAQYGCATQPGLSLLRLAQGDVEAASAGVRRALAEVTTMPDRLDLLKAAVTVHVEEGDLEAARDAVTEFESLTAELTTAAIEAEGSAIKGALALAAGDAGAALPLLRRAVGAWQTQDAPHEVAKLNVLIGQACRALGDHDGAQLEFSAARETFERLGARPDLMQLERIASGAGSHGLTHRELQVLCAIAQGKSNRAIANELHLSERTVHRHVANIFTKLGVDSRTAAVAHAIKQRIVEVGIL